MAERTGLEPATPGVTGRYSNQLNYRSALKELFFVKHTAFGVAYCANFRPQSLMPSKHRQCRISRPEMLCLVGADGIEPPTFAL
jgi:hypothetical protein